MIVDYGSARMLSGYDTYKVLDSDHIEVCKPLSRSDPSYELLIFSLKDWQQVRKLVEEYFYLASICSKKNLTLLYMTCDCEPFKTA
jgi:hypothetical protein